MQHKITTRLVKSQIPSGRPFEIFDTEIKGFVCRIEPTGTKSYYLAYRTKSGRRRRFRIGRVGNVTVAQARDRAAELAAQVALGLDPQEQVRDQRARLEREKFNTLGGFLALKYGPWVKTHRKTGEETLRRIETCFFSLLETPMSEITGFAVESWRVLQKRAGKQPSTINRDVSALKAVLARAVEWAVLADNPIAKVKPLKVDAGSRPRFLSEDEARSLRSALEDRNRRLKDKREAGNQWRRQRGYEEMPPLGEGRFADHLMPMVLLTLNTGLRRGELLSLTWESVDLDRRLTTIRGDLSKSGRTRHIPLNDEAVQTLSDWRAQQDSGARLVFPGRGGRQMGHVRRSWGAVLEAAGIKNFRWHDLRHDFASQLVMEGVPLNTVRELLGHTDIATTMRYAHLSPSHTFEAVKALDR